MNIVYNIIFFIFFLCCVNDLSLDIDGQKIVIGHQLFMQIVHTVI